MFLEKGDKCFFNGEEVVFISFYEGRESMPVIEHKTGDAKCRFEVVDAVRLKETRDV